MALGRVAQLVRALPLQGRGRRFEPYSAHIYKYMIRKKLLTCASLILYLGLVSCSPNNQLPSPNYTPTETDPTSTNTVESIESEPTSSITPIPATFTPTNPITPTNPENTATQGPDVLATLEAVQAALDTAAAKISTLEAEKNATGMPQPTSTTYYAPASQVPQSSPTPSNITTAVIITGKANLRRVKNYNNVGNPVMVIYKPRLKLEQGTYTWIYKDPIMSDGGIIYYEIHDPDGVVTTVFYIRKADIQVRSQAHNTSYGPVPLDVVKADFIIKANLREIKNYNDKGVPIMGIPSERVIFEAGDSIWIYPVPLESDGGTIYYLIFDPDGNASRVLYVRDKDLLIPNTLQ